MQLHQLRKYFTAPRVQRGFLVKFFRAKLGTQLRISVPWSAQASLSQHSLAWHDLDLAFRNFGPSPPEWLLSPSAPPPPPPQLPQSSETLAWSGWPESHLTLLPPEPLPRRPPKHGEFFKNFLGEIWRFSASVLGHPPKSVQTSVQTILANNPHRNLRKKTVQKPFKKSVQKIHAKNPCKKSVQKIRAEIRAKNQCKTNPCKRLPQSNTANWETQNFTVIFVRVVLLQVGFGKNTFLGNYMCNEKNPMVILSWLISIWKRLQNRKRQDIEGNEFHFDLLCNGMWCENGNLHPSLPVGWDIRAFKKTLSGGSSYLTQIS